MSDNFDVGDAWGMALLDQLHGRPVPTPELEVGGGEVGPAMHPEWFFRTFEHWEWWERELMAEVERGPVLDLGAGAGRVSLYLQERGFAVTAVESSPGAAEVCRQRGVNDVRLGDLTEPPDDHRWAAVLLLCGNLGLGGSLEGCRRLLTRLVEICAPDAVLVGDTVDPHGPGDVLLRIRHSGVATPWWPQYNIAKAEVGPLVDGTGWRLERHLEDGDDHAVLLRNDATVG